MNHQSDYGYDTSGCFPGAMTKACALADAAIHRKNAMEFPNLNAAANILSAEQLEAYAAGLDA